MLGLLPNRPTFDCHENESDRSENKGRHNVIGTQALQIYCPWSRKHCIAGYQEWFHSIWTLLREGVLGERFTGVGRSAFAQVQ
jgi:hypothetical protein